MSSEAESTEREDEDLSSGLLLRDIEEISKALYLHNTPHKTSISRSKSNSVTIQNPSSKAKKSSSLWKWKPLKALAHIRSNRFNCCFFLHVHTVEGLPTNFENLNLCVNWNRKNDVSTTRPARVCSGIAEFEQSLMRRCTIYGSKSGPDGSAKYEPKIFSIRVSVVGPTEFDIGNHWIDLSRLLPITMEELARDKGNSSGKWTTSFKLTGEAKGAILNVSFGFSLSDGNSFQPGYSDNLGNVQRFSTEGLYLHSRSASVNFHEELFPNQELELSHSVSLLYRKLDEKKTRNVMDFDHSIEFNETDFDVIEQGIEVSTQKNQIKIEKDGTQRFESTSIETIDVADIFEEDTAFDEYVGSDSKLTDNHEKLEYNIERVKDSLLDINNYYDQEDYVEPESKNSLISLDDVSESIENDFLKMLTIDQSQDDETDDYDLSFPVPAVEQNHDNVNEKSSLRSRRNAKLLENLETEALMQEWGITEKAFQYSPHINSGGFGSPVYIPAEEPLKLPCIEEGVGPIIRTKDGGFLRSMNPLLFSNANNGSRLIVQVSAPIVLPSEMGFTVMENLRCWASGGFEKMCVRVNELMPLEDVTGKTMREVSSEGESGSNAFNREALRRESDIGVVGSFVQGSENVTCSNSEPIESDYVSFEDLVPTAITNLECLLLEGLKIQSALPDQEPPSSIKLEPDDAFVDIDELTNHFMSLDEWIRLDSSEIRNPHEADKNFRMCFNVQLRDPSRNYETVGPWMLAIIHVDRIYSPSFFKVSEVHLSGLIVSNGGDKQLQSGSRWLFSSGMMTKSNKNRITSCTDVVDSSNGLSRKARPRPGDVLWSISSLPDKEEEDGVTTWDEKVALSVHVRNPDIVFDN